MLLCQRFVFALLFLLGVRDSGEVSHIRRTHALEHFRAYTVINVCQTNWNRQFLCRRKKKRQKVVQRRNWQSYSQTEADAEVPDPTIRCAHLKMMEKLFGVEKTKLRENPWIYSVVIFGMKTSMCFFSVRVRTYDAREHPKHFERIPHSKAIIVTHQVKMWNESFSSATRESVVFRSEKSFARIYSVGSFLFHFIAFKCVYLHYTPASGSSSVTSGTWDWGLHYFPYTLPISISRASKQNTHLNTELTSMVNCKQQWVGATRIQRTQRIERWKYFPRRHTARMRAHHHRAMRDLRVCRKIFIIFGIVIAY